jgi:hypothetical protein
MNYYKFYKYNVILKIPEYFRVSKGVTNDVFVICPVRSDELFVQLNKKGFEDIIAIRLKEIVCKKRF